MKRMHDAWLTMLTSHFGGVVHIDMYINSCTGTSTVTGMWTTEERFEHSHTKAHLAAISIPDMVNESTLENSLLNSQFIRIMSTSRVFRSASSEAECCEHCVVRSEAGWQEWNGVNSPCTVSQAFRDFRDSTFQMHLLYHSRVGVWGGVFSKLKIYSSPPMLTKLRSQP